MCVLVTYGSKRGGTKGIAQVLSASLHDAGVEVLLVPAQQVRSLAGFDAVVVGGALYANRWHHAARRFVARHELALRRVPVWFFSSGPLDDSAFRTVIPPVYQLEVLMERVGGQGHVTFGGRLSPDARGFPASAMAKKHPGDWRHPEQIGAWGLEIAAALPSARPRPAITQPGHALAHVTWHGLAGWGLCAGVMALLLATASVKTALVLHALAAPLIFALVARHYFRRRGAREPWPVALAFTATVALLDYLVVATLVVHSFVMFGSLLGVWLPLALIFIVTWATGEVVARIPPNRRSNAARASAVGGALSR
jgi:menaquinone-dependent protoporphyrinogen oxidase